MFPGVSLFRTKKPGLVVKMRSYAPTNCMSHRLNLLMAITDSSRVAKLFGISKGDVLPKIWETTALAGKTKKE